MSNVKTWYYLVNSSIQSVTELGTWKKKLTQWKQKPKWTVTNQNQAETEREIKSATISILVFILLVISKENVLSKWVMTKTNWTNGVLRGDKIRNFNVSFCEIKLYLPFN